jgi:hypothetical protein
LHRGIEYDADLAVTLLLAPLAVARVELAALGTQPLIGETRLQGWGLGFGVWGFKVGF